LEILLTFASIKIKKKAVFFLFFLHFSSDLRSNLGALCHTLGPSAQFGMSNSNLWQCPNMTKKAILLILKDKIGRSTRKLKLVNVLIKVLKYMN
jgi:hypothetical protein